LAYHADALSDFSEVPIVSANIPGFKPFVRISRNKGRMPVVITSVLDPALLPERSPAVEPPADPLAALEDIGGRIGNALLVVVVYANRTYMDHLAARFPGIDLLVDGFSRKEMPEADLRTAPPVVSNNNKGMYVAYADYGGEQSAFLSHRYIRATVGKIDEDPAIQELYTQWLREKQAIFKERKLFRAPDPASSMLSEDKERLFAGSNSCRGCHTKITLAWSSGKHARAHESLMQQERGFDPDCLTCHTTGGGGSTAANAMASGQQKEQAQFLAEGLMAGVHCEACHGPAGRHVKNPSTSAMATVPEGTCMKCHTMEKDPEFQYSRDVDRIHHGTECVGLNCE
jgi:hypothetical protein